MVNPRWILSLPDPWTMIQYSFRLETFVLFGICGAVIAALRLLDQDAHRWLIGLLLPILMFSVINAAVQRHEFRTADFTVDTDGPRHSSSTFNIGDYADGKLQAATAASRRKPVLSITWADLKHGALIGRIAVSRARRARLHQLAHASEAARHRRCADRRAMASTWFPDWQDRWGLVLKVNQDATPGKAHLVIREARSLPIVGGRIISILGLLGLLANAAVIARGGWQRRRAR